VHNAPQDRLVRSQPGRAGGLQVPEPRFPRTAARQPKSPAPGAAAQLARPGVEQLRWARCPDHGQLHLVEPAAVSLAVTRGYAPALCGCQIVAEGLTINGVPYGALCMACVLAATHGRSNTQLR
jgi:hypothetical protein